MGTTRPHATSSSEMARARRSSRSACPWPGVPSRAGRSRDECLACQAPPFSCHRHCAPLRSGLASCAKQDQPPASMQAASPCTWAAAVCQHVCSKRNETRRARPPACGAGARLYGAEGIGCRYCRHAGGQPSARGVGACSSAVQTQEVDSKTGEGAAAGRTGYAIESNEKSPALQVPVGRRPPRPRSLGSPATAPLASMNSQAPVVKQSSPESFGSANPFIPFGGLLMRSEVRFSAYRPLFCSKREIREATGEQDDIAERAGSAGFQRLRPHGDARPPHEQGAGALRFGSDGAAAGADGGRPTSRGLPPAKVCVGRRCLAPRGQGGAAGVRRRRCLPLRGKSASELARRILVCRGRKQKIGAFCPS